MDYAVDLDDQNPNDFFVQEPSEDIVVAALTDEGLSACVLACQPQLCDVFYLEGTVDRTEHQTISDAVVEAYVAANPGVNPENLYVSAFPKNTTLQDKDG